MISEEIGRARARARRSAALFIAAWACSIVGPTTRAESLLLRNATAHTVAHGVRDSVDVLVRDGVIARVESAMEASADREIDLRGMHLYPGLIAATSALGLIEINSVRATRDHTEVGAFTPSVRSWLAVNPDSELIPVTRANGVTHTAPAPAGGVVAGYSGLIALKPWTIEDMLVKPYAGLHVYWPRMSLDSRPKSAFSKAADWKSPADQKKGHKKRVQEIAQFFEDAAAYFERRSANDPNFQPNPEWDAMGPAMDKTAPLMVHANTPRQIRSALEWSRARDYPIVLVGGRDAWRLAEDIAAQNVPVIYEHIYTQPARDTDPYDVHFRAPSLLAEAGVTLIISRGGGGGGAADTRNLPHEAAQAMAYGLDPDDALKAITLHPAQVFGVDDRLGSIEPGKEATLFASDADILDVRASVKRMWFSGKEADLSSRHTRLYDRYRNRPQPGE